MSIWGHHLHLLCQDGGLTVLRTVDRMVGHEVSRVLQFLDHVRDRAESFGEVSLTNLLRLILMNPKYFQYPDLDKLIMKMLEGGAGGSLLTRCMASEALRCWMREMRALAGPDGRTAAHDKREQAASLLIDSMEEDPAWNSASNLFATRLNEPTFSTLTAQKRNSFAFETPVAGLTESESEFLSEAMERFSQQEHSTSGEGAIDTHAADHLSNKRDLQGGGHHPRVQKRRRPEESSPPPTQGGGEEIEEAGAKSRNALNDAISRCSAVRLQVDRVSSGRSGAQSSRQTGTVAAAIVRALICVSSFDSAAEQARCLATLMLWRAGDELLEATAGLLVASEEANNAALGSFLSGAVLPKIRAAQSVASRVLVRVLETVARVRVDMVVDCVIAPSVALWPSLPHGISEAACTALGIDSVKQITALFARKNALELALRLARSQSGSISMIFTSICDQQRQSVTPREAHMAYLLDVFLSPLAVCCAFGKQKKKNQQTRLVLPAAGSTRAGKGAGTGALPSATLDTLLETVWRPFVATQPPASLPPPRYPRGQNQDCDQGQGQGFVDVELLKGLTSLVLVTPPRGLAPASLGALLERLEGAADGEGVDRAGAARGIVGDSGSGGGSGGEISKNAALADQAAQALCSLLTSVLSRHRAEVKQAGVSGRVRSLVSREGVSSHAQGVLRLLDGL